MTHKLCFPILLSSATRSQRSELLPATILRNLPDDPEYLNPGIFLKTNTLCTYSYFSVRMNTTSVKHSKVKSVLFWGRGVVSCLLGAGYEEQMARSRKRQWKGQLPVISLFLRHIRMWHSYMWFARGLLPLQAAPTHPQSKSILFSVWC